MWHEIDRINTSDSGEISALACVPAESYWFSGHFPNAPVLPGIAQLGMVYETVLRVIGREFCLAGVSRVKFKKMIRPSDPLKISITPKKGREGAFSFRIRIANDLACSGNLALVKRDRMLKSDD